MGASGSHCGSKIVFTASRPDFRSGVSRLWGACFISDLLESEHSLSMIKANKRVAYSLWV